MPQKVIPVVDDQGRAFDIRVVSLENSPSVNDPNGINQSERKPRYMVEMRGVFIGDVAPQSDGTYVRVSDGTIYRPV